MYIRNKASAKDTIDYEMAFADLKKTVDGMPEQLAAINKEVQEIAKTMPVSVADLSDIVAAGGQLKVHI